MYPNTTEGEEKEPTLRAGLWRTILEILDHLISSSLTNHVLTATMRDPEQSTSGQSNVLSL